MGYVDQFRPESSRLGVLELKQPIVTHRLQEQQNVLIRDGVGPACRAQPGNCTGSVSGRLVDALDHKDVDRSLL